MGTMIEFAIVIGLMRYVNLKRKKSPGSEQTLATEQSDDIEFLITKIDAFALVGCVSFYTLFNIVYWIYHLI